jgi:hypothetical protein
LRQTSKPMARIILVILGILLILLEILGVYFIMPLPGSQYQNTLNVAYWLHNNILWIRGLLLFALVIVFVTNFAHLKRTWKIASLAILVLWGVIFYLTHFKFKADIMFLQPGNKHFATAKDNKVPVEKLVVGVTINGEAKAYPIQLIGYHHQVRDTIGNTPAMITYCIVCRTGRVFQPLVDGKTEDFRLVGMDHFNAMFEDKSTKSWWQQATGSAVVGKLKGKSLTEIPSQQSTLASWLRRYPQSLILQPDTNFNHDYKDLEKFDDGTTKDKLHKRDSSSWNFKSWVVGVSIGHEARAYDWNTLVDKRIIIDSLQGMPLLISLETDTATFHVLNRNSSKGVLHFALIGRDSLRDLQTGSSWDLSGRCTHGNLKGEQLPAVQASQEFWHSWQTFHPRTSRYE